MLTTEAFNALLKTLEEPPGHTLFVLATTEFIRSPPPSSPVASASTFVASRRRPSSNGCAESLEAEGVDMEKDGPMEDREAADGGLRDALGLLEQTAAYGGGRVTAEAAAHVVGGVESAALLELIGALAQQEVVPARAGAAWRVVCCGQGRAAHPPLRYCKR